MLNELFPSHSCLKQHTCTFVSSGLMQWMTNIHTYLLPSTARGTGLVILRNLLLLNVKGSNCECHNEGLTFLVMGKLILSGSVGLSSFGSVTRLACLTGVNEDGYVPISLGRLLLFVVRTKGTTGLVGVSVISR